MLLSCFLNENEIVEVQKLIYDTENMNLIINQIQEIKNPYFLHTFIYNYNWNNGFQIPKAITQNKSTDLGTALLMFHLAEGFSLFESEGGEQNKYNKDWLAFIKSLYDMIVFENFKFAEISYNPTDFWTKTELFKLKKSRVEMPDVFFNPIIGKTIDCRL